MAATGSISISGSVTGLPAGSKTIGPLTISSTAAVGQQQDIVLASGANTITVPSGASAAIIVFASASTTIKTLKGVTGDTGLIVSKVGKTVFQFDTSPIASFVINSSAADTGNTTSILFV